jgi:hypothetical protein
MSFPFLKKLVARKFEKQGTFFFGVRRTRRVAGLIHSFSFPSKKVRAKCIITAHINKRTTPFGRSFILGCADDYFW